MSIEHATTHETADATKVVTRRMLIEALVFDALISPLRGPDGSVSEDIAAKACRFIEMSREYAELASCLQIRPIRITQECGVEPVVPETAQQKAAREAIALFKKCMTTADETEVVAMRDDLRNGVRWKDAVARQLDEEALRHCPTYNERLAQSREAGGQEATFRLQPQIDAVQASLRQSEKLAADLQEDAARSEDRQRQALESVIRSAAQERGDLERELIRIRQTAAAAAAEIARLSRMKRRRRAAAIESSRVRRELRAERRKFNLLFVNKDNDAVALKRALDGALAEVEKLERAHWRLRTPPPPRPTISARLIAAARGMTSWIHRKRG